MGIKRTLREKKFIKNYIKNVGNATQSYLDTFPKYKGKNADKLGPRMWGKMGISISELLELMGTTDFHLNEKLNEGLDATKVISVIPIPPKDVKPSTGDLPNANSKNREFIDVPDYNIRFKYIDMAYKLKNKYPAEKHEVAGPGGGPITYKEYFPALDPEKKEEK